MDELLVGAATVDITPPVGAILVGYHSRRSTSVGSPLRAEALAVRRGAGGWILVTADLCALSRPLVQAVRSRVASRLTIAPTSVMLTADHTLSGPAANKAGWVSGHPDQAYFDELERSLADVAVRAWSDAAPAMLEVGTAAAPALASNRRVRGADGVWRNDWTDPEGRHTGPFDPTVNLLGARRPGGERVALLVTYGCHPVVLGPRSMAITADYCGHLKRSLEESGVTRTALFAVAGHGDVDPRVCVQDDEDRARRMGEELSRIVAEAARGLRPIAAGAVCAHAEPWAITRTRTLDETPDMQFLRLIRAGEVFETEVSALRAGPLAVVGLPGEALTEVAAAVRRRSPFAHTLVLSLANDTVGYLPTDEVQRQGSHEVNYAPAEGLEQPLIERADRALAAVAACTEGGR